MVRCLVGALVVFGVAVAVAAEEPVASLRVVVTGAEPGKGRVFADLFASEKGFMRDSAVYAYSFDGVRYDCGSKLGYLQATVAYGLEHPDTGARFRQHLEELLREPAVKPAETG